MLGQSERTTPPNRSTASTDLHQLQDQLVSWERQIRKIVQVKKLNRGSVVSGPEFAVHPVSGEPDPYGEPLWPPKIGVRVNDLIDLNDQSGLLQQLSLGGLADLLAPLNMSTGNAPFAGSAAEPTLDKQNLVVLDKDHCHADRWPSIMTAVAIGTLPRRFTMNRDWIAECVTAVAAELGSGVVAVGLHARNDNTDDTGNPPG